MTQTATLATLPTRLILALGLVLALLVGVAHTDASAKGTERRILLTATSAGRSIGASGAARVRTDGARQDFRISMDARVAAGTTFRVYITSSAYPNKTFLVGRVRIVAGRGELEVSNDNGRTLPAGVSPVLSIRTVVVRNGAGTAVLRGSF
ncbi:MAG: hypothetical protein M3281_03495 [Chloroflexota bacterium]|nr:hypothetical protein [Chloroflexota bacterium]